MEATRPPRLGIAALLLLLLGAACVEGPNDGRLSERRAAVVVAETEDDPVMDAVLAWAAKASVSGACYQVVVDIEDCDCACDPHAPRSCQCASTPFIRRQEACLSYQPWTGTRWTSPCRRETLTAVSQGLKQCRETPACAPKPPTLTLGGPDKIEVGPGGTAFLWAVGAIGGLSWTITTNNSGGTVSADGVYTAGPLGGTDTVTATDTAGARVTVQIRSSTANSVVVLAGDPSGRGAADGAGAAARLWAPGGLALDWSGNLLIADSGNHTIRKLAPDGALSTVAGTPGECGSVDTPGPSPTRAAMFCSPGGVSVGANGNIYVADTVNHTIRWINGNGWVYTIAGRPGEAGYVDDPRYWLTRLSAPKYIAASRDGIVYVSDTYSHTIRKVDVSSWAVTTFAGAPGQASYADGTGGAARFSYPKGLAVDWDGNLYVADAGNAVIRKVTPGGVVSTVAGLAGRQASADGRGAAARFGSPGALSLGSRFGNDYGSLYVADDLFKEVRVVSTATADVTTIAGPIRRWQPTRAPGIIPFTAVSGVAGLSPDAVFVSDDADHAIRKVRASKVVTTVAGKAAGWGSVDGQGGEARFAYPRNIAIGPRGDVFVADGVTVRRISSAGAVTTIAGSPGQPGTQDGTGNAARFSGPMGLAFDPAGNLLVVDSLMVRKVTLDGVVTSIAGAPLAWGTTDGTGATARFSFPLGIAVDRSGNAFVADEGAHTIRKVTPAGVVTTFAGAANSPGSADGVGSMARFNAPRRLAFDAKGDLFVADSNNHTIRRITPAGAVSTFAGTPAVAGSLPGQLRNPSGVAVDEAGNVYVADTGNNAIQRITARAGFSTVVGVSAPSTPGNFMGPLPANLAAPEGVAVGPNGALYIVGQHGVLVASLPLDVAVNGGELLTVESGVPVQVRASGGGGGYTWALAVNNTGGSVTPDGVYVAGDIAGSDTLIVTDARGASRSVTITSVAAAGAAERALGWLVARQAEDGRFSPGFRHLEHLYTSEAALALDAWRRRTSTYYRALAWLESHPSRNVDDAARRMMALAPAGGNTEADASRISRALVPPSAARSGGLGLTETYLGDPLDTALAVRAYQRAGLTEIITPGTTFLVNQQLGQGAGGWAVSSEAVSEPTATAQSVLALAPEASGDAALTASLTNALAALELGAASVPEVALTTMASLRLEPTSARSARLRHWLISRQAADGSWDQDVYATAVALRALAQATGRTSAAWEVAVAVPDAALRAAINKALGQNALDGLDRGQLARLTQLSIASTGVRDLTGLEHAINLRQLDARNAPVASFDPVAALTNLTVLR